MFFETRCLNSLTVRGACVANVERANLHVTVLESLQPELVNTPGDSYPPIDEWGVGNTTERLSNSPASIDIDESLFEAARRMRDSETSCLTVVEDSKPVGMITALAIVKAIVNRIESFVEPLDF